MSPSVVRDDDSGSDSVQCITDLSTCCSGAQGNHCGDWYFPDGTRLPRYLRVSWRESLYIIETIPPHQLVFIVAVLVQTWFMVITITQRGNQSL